MERDVRIIYRAEGNIRDRSGRLVILQGEFVSWQLDADRDPVLVLDTSSVRATFGTEVVPLVIRSQIEGILRPLWMSPHFRELASATLATSLANAPHEDRRVRLVG